MAKDRSQADAFGGPGWRPRENPRPQAFLDAAGVTCQTTAVSELAKTAGIACLTGVLWRG